VGDRGRNRRDRKRQSGTEAEKVVKDREL